MSSSRPFPAARRRTSALALLLATTLVAGCGDDAEEGTDAGPSPSSTPSETASETASPSVSPTPSETTDRGPAAVTPVYFAVDTRAGLRLAREPRAVIVDPATDGVEAMLDGPEDPDYSSTWNPGTRLLGIDTADDGTITVDLSAEVREANVGSPGAALMVQQLVWTVTEAIDPDAGVQLLVEGRPAGELWGAVSWDEPVTREPADDVRMLVGIDSPAEGELVTSPVTVSGEANAFEANVPWRVLDEQGDEVDSGFTTAAEGMRFAPYSFSVELEPGTWTVEVTEDDPSGGEGGEPMADSRTITVE